MKVYNRTFNRDYTEIETVEAGIALTGAEVKAVRAKNIKLVQSFARVMRGELFLVNADIPIYQFARPQDYNPTRSRKLLLHKKQITRLISKLQSSGKLTLIPVSCYNKGPYIKISLALAKGKRDIEKKKVERREDIKRQQEQEMKEYIKR